MTTKTPENRTPPVRRGLDLGFGFTKFSTGEYSESGGLTVSAFPSYAAPALGKSIGGGVLANLNVLNVSVGDERFCIGEDVRRAADGAGRQWLESTFFKSSQYLALAFGAFAYMNIPPHGNLDTLVMGLPLNVYGDKSIFDHISSSLTGTHLIPDISQSDGSVRSIHVKDVNVIPQVVGSLLSMSSEWDLMEQIHEQQNLTVDAGYGTLLWLVSDGFNPVPARSGGNMGGVSSLLQKVIRSVDPQVTTNLNILDRLDQALLHGRPSFKIHGEESPLAKHKALLASAVGENITELLRSIQTSADIDNVFLTGGGAHLYKDGLASAFPNRKIITAAEGSRYTNVRGFQLLAETRG